MTRNHVAVLKELAAHAGQDGRINPSKATLAERTELGERTVARALDAARAAQLVRWDRQRKPQWGSWQSVQDSNSYEILVPPEWQSPEIVTRRSGGQIGREIAEPSAFLLSTPLSAAEWAAVTRKAALAQARGTVAWLEGTEDST